MGNINKFTTQDDLAVIDLVNYNNRIYITINGTRQGQGVEIGYIPPQPTEDTAILGQALLGTMILGKAS